MKNKIILSLILTAALMLSLVTVYAEDNNDYYTFEDGMGKEEIPYGAHDNVGTCYGYSSFKMMNETQAQAAGVPEGYSGWVLALGESSNGTSIGLDLTDIKVKDIERIKFRVWCPTGTKQDSTSGGVRISGNSATTWNMLSSPSAIGEWIDIVLEKDFSSFDFDGDGYCDPTNFCFRGAKGVAYIDYITVELRPADTVAPVITYEGETVINTTAGKIFTVDATAYDEYDKANVAPEYIYSEGAVDGKGLLLEGEHTCTVRFTDAAGNFSELELTLSVEPQDVTAPTLGWSPDAIYANTGMRPVLGIIAEDDKEGEIVPTLTWSEGALDSRGRLTEGEHTLTVIAVDSTGNKTEKVIPVIVTSGLPDKG